jgi:AhpD family alkylhydroperoxidase
MKARIEFPEIPHKIMSSMMFIEKHIGEMGFSDGLLELIRLRVSYINGCDYCVNMHFKDALEKGEDLHRLYSVPLWKDSTFYSEQERACMAWAEYVTLPAGVNDEQTLFEDLLTHFDKGAIANLTLAIIQINAWNRLMKSFGINAGLHR